jgi:hypothetical protein
MANENQLRSRKGKADSGLDSDRNENKDKVDSKDKKFGGKRPEVQRSTKFVFPWWLILPVCVVKYTFVELAT